MFYIPTDEMVNMIVFIEMYHLLTHHKGVEQSQFEARLSCGNLDINGPGQQRFEVIYQRLY